MQRKMLIVFAVAVAAAAASCSTQTKQLPTTTPPATQQPVPGIGATSEVAPPAGAAGSAQEAVTLQPYQGQVKQTWTEGSIEYDGIVSNSPCQTEKDCTSTTYINTPKNENECTCAAPCTPYVVNLAEKARREEANRRLCDTDDWYGPRCPAPDCTFIEFDRFKCREGKCTGLAMGKAP